MKRIHVQHSRIELVLVVILTLILVLTACTQQRLPLAIDLPIDFLFNTQQGEKANLLGVDIAYLGSAPMGSVYSGAREEDASLVVIRWNGQDHFYSLKGLDINQLDKIVCKVDCDIKVSIVEGSDVMVEIYSIDLSGKQLSEPKVIWDRATVKPPASTSCDALTFKKGGKAVAQQPLKLRSSAEIPVDFNSNVISYMNVGEEVEVLQDSQDIWVNIKKSSEKTGWAKQCTTLNGRLLNPK